MSFCLSYWLTCPCEKTVIFLAAKASRLRAMLPCMCVLSLSMQVLDLVLETSGMSSAELPLAVAGLEIVC